MFSGEIDEVGAFFKYVLILLGRSEGGPAVIPFLFLPSAIKGDKISWKLVEFKFTKQRQNGAQLLKICQK